jgi:hypothetical protein
MVLCTMAHPCEVYPDRRRAFLFHGNRAAHGREEQAVCAYLMPGIISMIMLRVNDLPKRRCALSFIRSAARFMSRTEAPAC